MTERPLLCGNHRNRRSRRYASSPSSGTRSPIRVACRRSILQVYGSGRSAVSSGVHGKKKCATPELARGAFGLDRSSWMPDEPHSEAALILACAFGGQDEGTAEGGESHLSRLGGLSRVKVGRRDCTASRRGVLLRFTRTPANNHTHRRDPDPSIGL